MTKRVEWLDELDGFRAGDRVLARGEHVGVIKGLLQIEGHGCRAHVYWPTIPFECEGAVSPGGSENFVDLDKLTKVGEAVRAPRPTGDQLALL